MKNAYTLNDVLGVVEEGGVEKGNIDIKKGRRTKG
jgi:hypothetical protein